MKQYNLVNNVMGWLAFAVAAVVYCSTIEPTASFWDCPEFITTGYKLEVGHPPGAPFFMLTANLFSHFASDATQVARWVNTMSALLSATTILFLFWTITHLTRKLVLKDWADLTLPKLVAIEASGLVGALIYTFSDTFWFSAVEGEVYAYSSAFTAIVFWLILKWEDHADEPHSDRWLLLIAYMTGLSIGVHLLNLLCIPAIVLVFVYRKFPDVEVKGSLFALAVSFVLVAAVLYGIVPGIVTVGGWFELFFVNTLGLPFNTGEIVYIITLVACVVWAIWENTVVHSALRSNASFLLSVALLGIPFYGTGWTSVAIGVVVLAVLGVILTRTRRTAEKKRVAWVSTRIKNTALLAMLMIMIGYSSYALIVIRSSANTPMDQNSPEDIFTLGSYLSRDQYGDRPLFYGQAYTSQIALDVQGDRCIPRYVEGAPVYSRKEKATKDEKDSYEVTGHRGSHYVYAQNMLFPRMYANSHANNYEMWLGGVEGTEVPFDRCGEQISVKVPSQMENLRFFLSYQCNFMYWRYFMWNFAGRQNDLQSNGEPMLGNWITGIPFIDDAMLGPQDKLPDSLKNNKGHNVFYCLPLLLGLLGLFWQAWRGQRGIRQFWVVFFLFFMTGLAIVIYLNQTPSQPRERDYAYAGSFYAFAIWCGLGVAALTDLAKKHLRLNGLAVAAAVAVLCLCVPIQMASQTWDDHDRSGRYTCRDFGRNYLMTLPDKGNPVIFCNGDNDTFPLWYNQEVEGQRLDARVCNLSYLTTDWYIDQMRRPQYDSPALPITWKRIEFAGSANDYIEVEPDAKADILELFEKNPEAAKAAFGAEPFELRNILDRWVRTTDSSMHYIPTDTIYLTIDKEAVRRSGMMMSTDSIPDRMVISLAGKRVLYKNDLMMLEMLAGCNWTRPLYIARTVGEDNYISSLSHNLVHEGMADRITPFVTDDPNARDFDTERVWDNLMHRYRYGGLEKPGLYIDETLMRMCSTNRQLFAQLARHLIAEGDNKRAAQALAKAERYVPAYNVPHSVLSGSVTIAECYYLLGQHAKARKIWQAVWEDCRQYVAWYTALNGSRFQLCQSECLRQFYYMQTLLRTADVIDPALAKKHSEELNKYVDLYSQKGGTFGE